MDNLNLQSLNLESKWPRLTKLQDEVTGLEQRLREAESEVAARRGAIAPARERDLDAAAKAIRQGGKSPKATHEDEAKGRLAVAERNQAVMQRALESARTDLGHFLQQHRAELFADVSERRQEIAREAATAAREALRAFGQWSDMHYVLKGLQPPVEAGDNNAPAQRLTTAIIGPVATRSSDPDRGQVEAMLRYVASLGTGPTEGGKDAAA